MWCNGGVDPATAHLLNSPRAVLELLPHRFPFVLVDRVIEVADDRLVAIKNVSLGEPIFMGHFPAMPVFPGVLQLEAMAQAGALLGLAQAMFDPSRETVALMAMDEVKFRKPVVPGDQLRIEVLALRKGRAFKFSGTCLVDGQIVSSAVLLAGIVDSVKLGGRGV